MNMNEIYEAPKVELVKVSVESGFDGSLSTPGESGTVGGGEGEEI